MLTKTFGIAGATLAVAFMAASAQAAVFTWTGNGDVNDWQDTANWVSGSVPNSYSGQLSTLSSSDVVVFDSETATAMPAGSILTRTSWTSGGKNPQVQVLNGQVTFSNNLNWGWSGITTFIVGDGDMNTLAVADTGYTNLNRDPNGIKTYVVNADGTLKFRNNLTVWSDAAAKDAQIQLNGGTVLFLGTINANLTNDADDLVSFNSAGSTFTAKFGGEFADLSAVTAQFGYSFVDTTGTGLAATNNGDGTFTVTLVPEPASLAMGLLGLTMLAGRRRR